MLEYQKDGATYALRLDGANATAVVAAGAARQTPLIRRATHPASSRPADRVTAPPKPRGLAVAGLQPFRRPMSFVSKCLADTQISLITKYHG
jgi:hypothetical protein